MRTLRHTQSSSLDRAMGLPGYSPHQQSLVRVCSEAPMDCPHLMQEKGHMRCMWSMLHL